MDFLIAVIVGAGTLLLGIAGNLLANELYDRAPRLAGALIRYAVARLPKWKRSRYEEEWLAHLEECDGKIGKIIHAAGCVCATTGLKGKLLNRQALSKKEMSFALDINRALRRVDRKAFVRALSFMALYKGMYQGLPMEERQEKISQFIVRLEFRLERHATIRALIRNLKSTKASK